MAGGMPTPYQPPPQMNQSAGATIVMQQQGPGCLVRGLWYFFVGWWLAGLAITAGYLAALTVIGLPLAFAIFNVIPTLLTLRPRTQTVQVVNYGGTTIMRSVNIEQQSMLVRALYFLLVGWWLGALWLTTAYVLCLTIIGLPLGLYMMDRTGGVMTLHRH